MLWFLWCISWIFSTMLVAGNPDPLFKGLADAIKSGINNVKNTPTKTPSTTTPTPTPTASTSPNPTAKSNIFDMLFKTPKKTGTVVGIRVIKKNLSKDMGCEGCRGDAVCQTRCELENKMIKDNPVLVKFCEDSCGPVPGCLKLCIVRQFMTDAPMLAAYQYALFKLENCTMDVARKYTSCAVECNKSNGYQSCENDCFNNINSYEEKCWQTQSQLPADRISTARQCSQGCTSAGKTDYTVGQFYHCYFTCYNQMYYAMGWLTNHRGHNLDLQKLDALFSQGYRVTLSVPPIALLITLVLANLLL